MECWQHIKNYFQSTHINTINKEMETTLYRFDASSSINANLRVPLNAAALGTVTFYKQVKLKRIQIVTECYLNDSVAQSYNAPAKGLVYIAGSYLFGNSSAFGLTAAAQDAGQFEYDKILPPGTYTLTGTLQPLIRMHHLFDPASAGPVWNTATVSLTVIMEVEDIEQ